MAGLDPRGDRDFAHRERRLHHERRGPRHFNHIPLVDEVDLKVRQIAHPVS